MKDGHGSRIPESQQDAVQHSRGRLGHHAERTEPILATHGVSHGDRGEKGLHPKPSPVEGPFVCGRFHGASGPDPRRPGLSLPGLAFDLPGDFK